MKELCEKLSHSNRYQYIFDFGLDICISFIFFVVPKNIVNSISYLNLNGSDRPNINNNNLFLLILIEV